MVLEHQIEINKPPSDVWPVVTDPVYMIFWQEGYESTVILNGNPGESGAIFNHVFVDGKKKINVKEEVEVFNPPTRKESRFEYPTMTQRVTIHLEGESSTLVHLRIDARMTAFSFRLLSPLLKSSFQRKLEADMQRLRLHLEI